MKLTRPLRFALSAPWLLSAACAVEPSDTLTVEPDSQDGASLVTEEGAYGHVRVNTVDGPRTLSYRVTNGHAIHEGDLDLGPVEALRLRGGGARLGERWPGGVVNYAFDPDFTGQVCDEKDLDDCMYVRDKVRSILDEFEARLPLRFVEHTEGIPPLNRIIFRWDPDLNTAAGSTHTGMSGEPQEIKFLPKYLDNFSFKYPNSFTTRHELLHALGVWHEQSRADRDKFIDVQYQCIEDGVDNGDYEKHLESADLGPYDFVSIMHYTNTYQCVQSPVPDAGCLCPTMVPEPAGAAIDPSGNLTVEDVVTMYRMYAQPHGENHAGEQYGKALASGDFDGDGYDDLAVGAPVEDVAEGYPPTTFTDAGRVFVWKGTPAGLVAWRALDARSFDGYELTSNAKFGTALVAYDLDADGVDDLAIGAPGALGGAGAVFVARGSRTRGLTQHRVITQGNATSDDDAAGDHFGEALAAGPMTGLVNYCGNTAFMDVLAVGAPGDYILPGIGIPPRRLGSAFLFHEPRATCSLSAGAPPLALHRATSLGHSPLVHANPQTTDAYATALAIGDLDGDGLADLAIGAPGAASSAGRVYLYKGQLPPEAPSSWSSMADYQDDLAPTTGTRFGAALAIGTVYASGRQLAVGAPGGNGRVAIYSASSSFLMTYVTALTSGVVEAGDEFGAALAIANVDTSNATADLIIGAPGEDNDAGVIVVARGGSTYLTPRTELTQTNGALAIGDRDAGDRFGAALAVGSFDGGDGRLHTAMSGTRRVDIAAGAPGEKPESIPYQDFYPASGAVDTFHGVDGGAPTGWQHRHQEVSGAEPNP